MHRKHTCGYVTALVLTLIGCVLVVTMVLIGCVLVVTMVLIGYVLVVTIDVITYCNVVESATVMSLNVKVIDRQGDPAVRVDVADHNAPLTEPGVRVHVGVVGASQ